MCHNNNTNDNDINNDNNGPLLRTQHVRVEAARLGSAERHPEAALGAQSPPRAERQRVRGLLNRL